MKKILALLTLMVLTSCDMYEPEKKVRLGELEGSSNSNHWEYRDEDSAKNHKKASKNSSSVKKKSVGISQFGESVVDFAKEGRTFLEDFGTIRSVTEPYALNGSKGVNFSLNWENSPPPNTWCIFAMGEGRHGGSVALGEERCFDVGGKNRGTEGTISFNRKGFEKKRLVSIMLVKQETLAKQKSGKKIRSTDIFWSCMDFLARADDDTWCETFRTRVRYLQIKL